MPSLDPRLKISDLEWETLKLDALHGDVDAFKTCLRAVGRTGKLVGDQQAYSLFLQLRGVLRHHFRVDEAPPEDESLMDIETWSHSRHLTLIHICIVMLGHVFIRSGGNDDDAMKQLLCDIWPALVRWTLFLMKAYREGIILHVESVAGNPSPMLDMIMIFLSRPTPVTHALLKTSPALGISAISTFLTVETDHECEVGFLDNLGQIIDLYLDDFADDPDVRRAIDSNAARVCKGLVESIIAAIHAPTISYALLRNQLHLLNVISESPIEDLRKILFSHRAIYWDTISLRTILLKNDPTQLYLATGITYLALRYVEHSFVVDLGADAFKEAFEAKLLEAFSLSSLSAILAYDEGLPFPERIPRDREFSLTVRMDVLIAYMKQLLVHRTFLDIAEPAVRSLQRSRVYRQRQKWTGDSEKEAADFHRLQIFVDLVQKRHEHKVEYGIVGRRMCANTECPARSKQLTNRTESLPFPRCSQCQRIMYCSRDCQVQHWQADHRNACIKSPSHALHGIRDENFVFFVAQKHLQEHADMLREYYLAGTLDVVLSFLEEGTGMITFEEEIDLPHSFRDVVLEPGAHWVAVVIQGLGTERRTRVFAMLKVQAVQQEQGVSEPTSSDLMFDGYRGRSPVWLLHATSGGLAPA